MILFKHHDPLRFLMGKKSTGRKLGWNQAKEGSKDVQLRVNFNLPPFAWADIEKTTEKIDITKLSPSEFNKFGVADLDEYIEAYGDESRFKKRIDFSNIRFNPEFDFSQYDFLSCETAEKLRRIQKEDKKGSKFYLSKTDRKNRYYCTIPVKDGSIVQVPFKAMFFKDTNTKLGNIISISSDSAIDCISDKLGFCQLPDCVKCYGKSSEQQYCRKDIINCEESNKISGFILSRCNPDKMAEYIAKKYSGKIIRFCKHGDFKDKIQLNNFIKIADEVWKLDKSILFGGYTARDDLMDFMGYDSTFWQNLPNVVLNGSNRKYSNHFKGVYEYSGKNPRCIANCEKCLNCYGKVKNTTIEVKFHGNINDFEDFNEKLEENIRDLISEIVSDDLALLDEIRLAIIERDGTYAEYVNALMNNTYEMDVMDYLVEGAMEYGFSNEITSEDYLEGELIHLGEICDGHIDNRDNMEFWADIQEKLREFDLKGVLKLLQ